MCIGKRIDVHRVIAPQPPSIPISAALRYERLLDHSFP